MSSNNPVYIPEPPRRACGEVKEDGIYLRGAGAGFGGGEDGTNYLFTAVFPAPGDASGVVTGTPRTTVRVVDDEAVLANLPEADWLVAQSRTNLLDRQLDAHEVAIFGMPMKRRLGHGIMENVADGEEARQRLLALETGPDWPHVGRGLSKLSRATVHKERLHPLVLEAYAGYQVGKPWKVLAAMHKLLDRKNLPGEVLNTAIRIVEYIAPVDAYWRTTEELD